jgi:hypothetical protein
MVISRPVFVDLFVKNCHFSNFNKAVRMFWIDTSLAQNSFKLSSEVMN